MSHKGKVLLIEDDEDIAEMLSILLPSLGCAIDTAENGAEAFEYLRHANELPHLILLDLMMPVMNGWEFRAEQLRDPQLSQIPVVVMTGVRDARGQAEKLDADTYLAKPLDLSELEALVARYIG